jgi:hypothetical protein
MKALLEVILVLSGVVFFFAIVPLVFAFYLSIMDRLFVPVVFCTLLGFAPVADFYSKLRKHEVTARHVAGSLAGFAVFMGGVAWSGISYFFDVLCIAGTLVHVVMVARAASKDAKWIRYELDLETWASVLPITFLIIPPSILGTVIASTFFAFIGTCGILDMIKKKRINLPMSWYAIGVFVFYSVIFPFLFQASAATWLASTIALGALIAFACGVLIHMFHDEKK